MSFGSKWFMSTSKSIKVSSGMAVLLISSVFLSNAYDLIKGYDGIGYEHVELSSNSCHRK